MWLLELKVCLRVANRMTAAAQTLQSFSRSVGNFWRADYRAATYARQRYCLGTFKKIDRGSVIRRSAPTVAGDRIFDFRLGSDLTYRTEWNGVPDDWPNHLSLPDSGETWRWGHGRGLQGTGHAARPRGRIEISSRRSG